MNDDDLTQRLELWRLKRLRRQIAEATNQQDDDLPQHIPYPGIEARQEDL